MYPPGQGKCPLVKVWLHGKLRITFKNPRLQIIWLYRRTFGWLTGYFDRKKQNCGQWRSSRRKASSVRTVFGRCDVCKVRPTTVLFTEIMLLCWYDNSQLLKVYLNHFQSDIHRLAGNYVWPHTAVSRKVVGKSARDSPERHCGWFWVLFFSKEFERIGTKGHGNVFASAKGKQQK